MNETKLFKVDWINSAALSGAIAVAHRQFKVLQFLNSSDVVAVSSTLDVTTSPGDVLQKLPNFQIHSSLFGNHCN